MGISKLKDTLLQYDKINHLLSEQILCTWTFTDQLAAVDTNTVYRESTTMLCTLINNLQILLTRFNLVEVQSGGGHGQNNAEGDDAVRHVQQRDLAHQMQFSIAGCPIFFSAKRAIVAGFKGPGKSVKHIFPTSRSHQVRFVLALPRSHLNKASLGRLTRIHNHPL